jgi:hypothetical protein
MDNIRNCDTYINIPQPQTYRINLFFVITCKLSYSSKHIFRYIMHTCHSTGNSSVLIQE